nr:hypothetical protein [uncultured Mediterranean phage uvMED]
MAYTIDMDGQISRNKDERVAKAKNIFGSTDALDEQEKNKKYLENIQKLKRKGKL